MLRFQPDLARLPVPALEETGALYLELVRPLLGDRAYAATERAVGEFVAPGGRGETLQRRLLHWSLAHENWLEPFWDDWYLCDDTPLPINVSPGFVLAGSDRPQVPQAARLVVAAVRFKELADAQELEPDVGGGSPHCIREYSRVLATTRIPGATRDRLERHSTSRHVVVSRNGELFSLEVLDEVRQPYAIEDLERALQRMVEGGETPVAPVGVLTADTRRSWARVREALLRGGSLAMQEALKTIESAILLLVLDDGRPPRSLSAEAARLALHGDVHGRWFDKSIQLVVAGNGVSGFCMEHAGFDGRTASRFARFLAEGDDAAAAAKRIDPGAARLAFEPTEPLLAEVQRVGRVARALVGRTDVVVLYVEEVGKRSIARHGLSPDGFVQMAFQLAYFRLAGVSASTYESVDMKRFLHGRTEAMRSVSLESVAFVRSPGEASLRDAVTRHTEAVRRCQAGRGAERHLLGLRRMVKPDEPMPPLFADSGYETLTRSVLSTSSTRSTPGVELSCFGPVVDDGFGLSYTIHDDAVCVVVTNFHGLAGALAEQLEHALHEMLALVSS